MTRVVAASVFATLATMSMSAGAEDVPRVAFLNFEGGTLRLAGTDDATANETRIADMAREHFAYGDDPAARAAIVQAVAADWFPYNVIVTDRRPSSGHYMMSMIGPSSLYPEGTLGIAALDCDDNVEDDITFVFHHANDGYTAAAVAATTSQEIAHAFGLEHVDEPADIMNTSHVGGDPSFVDACLPTFSATPTCADQHAAYCGTAQQQNSHAELLALIGPRGADAGGAPIEIVSPAEGDHFFAGETIEVRVESTGDFEIERAELVVGSVLSGIDDEAPFGFSASDVTAGGYEFFVQATDADGRIAVSERVMVTVDVQTENRDEEPSLPPGFGSSRRGEASSGCEIGRRRPSGCRWLLVVLVALRRRSRL